jgi:hypothetical protein
MKNFLLTVMGLTTLHIACYSQKDSLTRHRVVMFSSTGTATQQTTSFSFDNAKKGSETALLSKEDSIAIDREKDSLNLIRFKRDSASAVQRGVLLGNSFSTQLGLRKEQQETLEEINYQLEMEKSNAKANIEDKESLFKEMALIERQRDISYKEVLDEEQFKKYLSVKRQSLNAMYLQDTKNRKLLQKN